MAKSSFLGLVIKDPLFKEMDDMVYNYNYPEYTSFGHSYFLGDPTRLYQTNNNINDEDFGNINFAHNVNYANQNSHEQYNNYADQKLREQYQYTGTSSYGDSSHSDMETIAALMDIGMRSVGKKIFKVYMVYTHGFRSLTIPFLFWL